VVCRSVEGTNTSGDFTGLRGSGQTSHNRLLLLRTKAVMMLDWGSGTLDITTAGMVGTAYCCMVLCVALRWCGQCLLKVGGNLLPHTVTPCDVITWHNAAESLGKFYALAEGPPAALQSSELQWTASVFSAWYYIGSSCSLFNEDNCLQLYLIHSFVCLRSYKGQVCQTTLGNILDKSKSMPGRIACRSCY